MNARMLAMLGLSALVFGGIFGFKWFGNRMMNRYFDSTPIPAVTVSTTAAAAESWPLSLTAVGTLRAVKGTDVTTEAAGIVDSIRFASGDTVDAGALLLTLDRATDTAARDALAAQAELARQELERVRRLFGRGAVSQSDLDRANAAFTAAKANVAAQDARIAQKMIRAPFAGVLGIRKVDLGQHLAPGDAIVNLQALDPIFVNFNLPQRYLGRVHTDLDVKVRLENYPGRAFHGRITALAAAVDVSTRNFEAQATLPNADHALKPGMFTQVNVELGDSESVTVVPQTAVSFNPYGDSVWIIKKDDSGALSAERRLIKTGQRRGDLVQILDGLAAGDIVATSGLLKLRNGVPVNVNNEVQPASETAPKLPNS